MQAPAPPRPAWRRRVTPRVIAAMRRMLSLPQWSSLVGHRGRGIARTAAWSLAAKVAAAANLFIAVPFVLHALGPQQFGAWATLVSLVYFAGFLDFGFGNGTMNLVAAAHGRGAPGDVAVILRESRRALAAIAAVLALVAVVALPLVPWHRLLGMPAALADDSRLAAGAVLFSIVLSVPLNLANRVQLGLGRGERAFQWQVAGQVLSICAVVGLCVLGASLPAITAAAVSAPLLASVANTVQLHRQARGDAAPVPGRHPGIAADIRREGTLFFVLQLTAALAFSADLPLIASLGSPEDAGRYAVVQRLFSVVPLALSLLWTPLWPAYRQAMAAANHDWAVRTLRRSLVWALLASSLAAAAIGAFFGPATRLWLGEALDVAPLLVAGCIAWAVTEAVGTALATFLNAASVLRFQVIVCAVFATTCLAAKVVAMYTVGYTALPLVTTVSYLLAVLVPTAFLLPGIVARIRRESRQ